MFSNSTQPTDINDSCTLPIQQSGLGSVGSHTCIHRYAFLPYSFSEPRVSESILSQDGIIANRYSLDEASRIYSLFDQDFLSICGEGFVITSAIGILVYGVLSGRRDSFPRFTIKERTALSSRIEFMEDKLSFPVDPLLFDSSQKEFYKQSIHGQETYKSYANYKTGLSEIEKEKVLDKSKSYGEKANKRSILFSGKLSSQISAPILVRNCGVHALLILFFATFLLVNNPLYGEAFYNSVILDYFTRFMQIGICLATLFSLVLSLSYLQKINLYELVVLILLASGSMLLLASASDLICMYAAIEFQSLCFYVLAGLKRNSESSTEAGLKYLLLGAFSSGILLFGCSLLYAFTGTTSFFECAHLLSNISENNIHHSNLFVGDSLSNVSESSLGIGSTVEISTLASFLEPQSKLGVDSEQVNTLPLRACQLGFTFLLVGLLFKCAAAPFHMWVPDVYEGAPTPITLFFSIVPKLSVFAVLIRLLSCGTLEGCTGIEQLQGHETEQILSIQQTGPYSVLVFSCIASLLVGTFSAISQSKIKRLLAYSSIGHVGFLLIGCTLHSGEGIVALLVYLLIYIAMTIPIFAYMLSPLARERYIQFSGSR